MCTWSSTEDDKGPFLRQARTMDPEPLEQLPCLLLPFLKDKMACRKILSPEVDSQTAKMGSLGCRMNRDSSGDFLASDRGRLTENILFMKEGRGLALQSERASVAGLSGSWLCTGDGGRLQEQTSGRPFRCHLPLGAICPGPQSSLLGGQRWLIHLCGAHTKLCVRVLEREHHQNRIEDLGSEP